MDYYLLIFICISLNRINSISEIQVKVGVLARVILGQVLSIVTCGSRTHIEETACEQIPNLPKIKLLLLQSQHNKLGRFELSYFKSRYSHKQVY